jgi:branched-chain amino acid transport system substrate-binding protein
VTYDIKELDAETLLSVYERLCSVDQVDAIISFIPGYLSGGIELDVTAKYGVPYFEQNTARETADRLKEDPEKHWCNFMMDCPNSYYGPRLVRIIEDILVPQGLFEPINNKVAYISATGAYDIHVHDMAKKAFTESGWETTVDELVTYGTVEWGPILSKMRSDPPAVIVLTESNPADCVAFQKQFNANPTKSMIYNHFTPSNPEYINLGGNEVDGIMWGVNIAHLDDSIGTAFYNEWMGRFNRLPDWVGVACVYDSFWCYADAVEHAGTTEPRAVSEWVLNRDLPDYAGEPFRGVCGYYKFFKNNEKGDWQWPHTCVPGPDTMPFHYYQIWDEMHVPWYPDRNPEGTPLDVTPYKEPPWWEKGLE